jgi:hypothetical protein
MSIRFKKQCLTIIPNSRPDRKRTLQHEKAAPSITEQSEISPETENEYQARQPQPCQHTMKPPGTGTFISAVQIEQHDAL